MPYYSLFLFTVKQKYKGTCGELACSELVEFIEPTSGEPVEPLLTTIDRFLTANGIGRILFRS